MSFHVRVCRECGEEYRPDIVRCADCGGELEDVYEDEGAPSPARRPPREPEPPDLSEHRAVFETARAADLVPLAERLREVQIAFHLFEREAPAAGAPASFSLLVHQTDVKAALEALAALLAPHAEADGMSALETRFEAGRGYVQCPACGTEQSSGATECPECGLALGPTVPTCPRCGAPLEEEGAACSTCGAPSPTE